MIFDILIRDTQLLGDRSNVLEMSLGGDL